MSKTLLILLSAILMFCVFLTSFLPCRQISTQVESNNLGGTSRKKPPAPRLVPVLFESVSPDRQYIVRTYFEDPVARVKLIWIGKATEKILYEGKEMTYPAFWVGNRHVAFYTKCGTSCQGTMLINIEDGSKLTGGISYMIPEPGETEWETIFKDWFGKIHKYKGLWGNMYGESVDGIDYVVLYETDEQGNVVEEQKLRFVGDRLI